MIFKSTGIVKYYPDYTCKLICDPAIVWYYYSLIPKYKNANSQRYDSHITIVRNFEMPKAFYADYSKWNKHQDRVLEYEYDNQIVESYIYFYLLCQSKAIGEIRKELGLTEFRTETGGYTCYHMTIGNKKDV